tara:strand:+ start:2257 stop:2991 length:735 start_codon:yes stop_codon:yes gene_type:complete
MINRDEFLLEIKEEKRFRKVLRKLLESYLKEKKETQLLEENRMRKIIRVLVKEGMSADVPDDQPQRSTGINVLENLLTNIISTIEDDYKSLTTSPDQRESFRAHMLNAVTNSLKPAELVMASPGPDKEEELEEDLEVNIEDEEKFIPVRDGDKGPDPEEIEEPDKFEPISGMNITGRNFASVTFNKVENQILDAYQSLGDQEDRSIFEDYLLTNLKLYFDRFEEELQPTVPEPESPDYEEEPKL